MGYVILFLLAGLAAGVRLQAQPTSSPPPAFRNPALPPTLPPTPARSPIDLFRDLLALKPAELETALASRSASSRAFLQAKLQEFRALPDAAREERLQTLQLRWHLVPLMRTPPGQRGPRLNSLSEGDRRLVEERLEQWDQLPADLQRKVLENENVIRLFFRSETNAPRPEITLTNFSPAQRNQMQKDQLRWRALPEEEQRRILQQFDRFFELNDKEKSRILKDMGEAERRQMQATLQKFARLPKGQREACLRGFQKFAALTPREREEFLNNAERWQALSPQDRQLWRDLVDRLPTKPPPPPRLLPKTGPLVGGATPGPRLPSNPAAVGVQATSTN